MEMYLPPGEPQAGPWRAASIGALLDLLGVATSQQRNRPYLVAVDGRSASGKTTLARRLAQEVPASVVVHTDDLAWNEPFFGWSHLLREVVETLHGGQPLRLCPPAWVEHGRRGSIDVPGGTPLVVVEGVGAGQREVSHLLDACVWVQSDAAEAERRGLERDLAQGVNGDERETVAFWHEWMRHELRFLAADRPWESATLVVAGTPVMSLPPGHVAIADGPVGPPD